MSTAIINPSIINFEVHRDGDVVWSTVVLIKAGSRGEWEEFASQAVAKLSSHTLKGVKEWMTDKELDGWHASQIQRCGVDIHLYSYYSSFLWIPTTPDYEVKDGKVTWSNVILRRATDSSSWLSFFPLPTERTLPELKAWMKANPDKGWRPFMFEQVNKDPHIWNCEECEFYIPDPPARFWVPKKGVSIKCVNSLGCEGDLTAGSMYVIKDWEDGLVRIVSDSGAERECLPERFEGYLDEARRPSGL